MPKRRSVSRNIPLEWKTDAVTVTDATVTTGEFDLDLLPDEIAEIYAIKSIISSANVPDAANDLIATFMYLSMDPDANDSPGLIASLEDLEVFFTHWESFQQEIGAAGSFATELTKEKSLMLPADYPILIGTNFSQVVLGDASIAQTFITTVYFKRRRANQSDLNQILLKRR